MLEIAEVQLSSCGLEVDDWKLRTSETIAIVELWLWSSILLKVADLPLRKFFLQVAELDCGLKKKLGMPTLVYFSYQKDPYPPFYHSWASASRKLMPASAFQHPEF
jgi:hypothetical protein